MGKKLSIVWVISFLVLAILACGTPVEEYQMRGWTITPSQVPATATKIIPTQTPYVIEITNTPEPVISPEPKFLCVTAKEAVYLRPSPEATYYPIEILENGTQVLDTGTREGNWAFVVILDKKGWINLSFLGGCG